MGNVFLMKNCFLWHKKKNPLRGIAPRTQREQNVFDSNQARGQDIE